MSLNVWLTKSFTIQNAVYLPKNTLSASKIFMHNCKSAIHIGNISVRYWKATKLEEFFFKCMCALPTTIVCWSKIAKFKCC